MKPVVIIALAFVLILPLTVFAQSSSQEGNCPIGTKPVVKGTNIECVQISNVKKTCPDGTYHGVDTQGNSVCKDIKTNQIVDPNTGLTYDSQTGEIVLDDEQMMYVGIGIFVVIVFVAVIAKASSSNSSSDSETKSFVRRGWTEDEKLEVRKRQHGVCKKCNNPPPRWQYDHIDGDHSNNDLSNCQGLCPNCHDVKTYEES